MKNLFKKSSKKTASSKIQKLDKVQLNKVVGGTDTMSTKQISTAEGPRYQ